MTLLRCAASWECSLGFLEILQLNEITFSPFSFCYMEVLSLLYDQPLKTCLIHVISFLHSIAIRPRFQKVRFAVFFNNFLMHFVNSNSCVLFARPRFKKLHFPIFYNGNFIVNTFYVLKFTLYKDTFQYFPITFIKSGFTFLYSVNKCCYIF